MTVVIGRKRIPCRHAEEAFSIVKREFQRRDLEQLEGVICSTGWATVALQFLRFL